MYVRAASRYQLLAGLRTAYDAVQYVDEHRTDLLILDILMRDGIDGLSAAERLRHTTEFWQANTAVPRPTFWRAESSESLSPCKTKRLSAFR